MTTPAAQQFFNAASELQFQIDEQNTDSTQKITKLLEHIEGLQTRIGATEIIFKSVLDRLSEADEKIEKQSELLKSLGDQVKELKESGNGAGSIHTLKKKHNFWRV